MEKTADHILVKAKNFAPIHVLANVFKSLQIYITSFEGFFSLKTINGIERLLKYFR